MIKWIFNSNSIKINFDLDGILQNLEQTKLEYILYIIPHSLT